METKQIQKAIYHSEFYNKADLKEQWIRITDGCFRHCWNCYCPTEKKVYDLPEIIRNKVRFMDMNFLYAHPNPISFIQSLPKKINGKVIRYTFLCGLDFTLFNQEIINAMKKARVGRFNNKGNFINGLSFAWDRGINEESLFNKAVEIIVNAGYLKRNIQILMLCNGKVSFEECLKKLKVLKKHRIQIADCWYDNQKRGSINPTYWTDEECKTFGRLCRSHNIAVIQNQYDSMDLLYKQNEEVKQDA